MEKVKVDRDVIFDKFNFLDTEHLENICTDESVNVEELSNSDYDTLIDTLCDGSYNPIEFYTKLINQWGGADMYELTLSNQDKSLNLTTYLWKEKSKDTVTIDGKNGFKSSDIFSIIDSINCQSQFYDLFITFESDEGHYRSTVYHGESFAFYKHWINDLMNQFRDGKLDKYHSVTITSNFDDLCIESSGNDIEDNRLYVMFE